MNNDCFFRLVIIVFSLPFLRMVYWGFITLRSKSSRYQPPRSDPNGPPNISHLYTPDDWYIRSEDKGYSHRDFTLLRLGFEPAHHIQYNRFEGQVLIKPGPKSSLGDANLANAWAMIDIMKGRKTIPDEWKGMRIVFAGSSYYRTSPHILCIDNYYVPDRPGMHSELGRELRVGERAHRTSKSRRTIHGIYDNKGEFVPVLHYRNHPKKVLCNRSVDFTYQRWGPTDPHWRTDSYAGLDHCDSPPGWDVEFVSVKDLDDSGLVFAVVPDGTTVLAEKNYEPPPNTYAYLREHPSSVHREYELFPVNKSY